MYVPATLALPAPALAPVGAISTVLATLATPQRTTLHVTRAQLNVLENDPATVSGTLQEGRRPARAGRTVLLQALGNRGWRTIVHARTRARGRFRLTYVSRWATSELVRLRFTGDATGRAARRRLGRLNVYRLAGASWYGGGGGLACGGSLTSSTLGVANKTLPCGTLVTLRYNGRSVRVPVIDRGPYVAGREFDLTEATKQAIGFGDTGQVWTTD